MKRDGLLNVLQVYRYLVNSELGDGENGKAVRGRIVVG